MKRQIFPIVMKHGVNQNVARVDTLEMSSTSNFIFFDSYFQFDEVYILYFRFYYLYVQFNVQFN